MAKDYFQDIVPAKKAHTHAVPAKKLHIHQEPVREERETAREEEDPIKTPPPERSIRNIDVPERREHRRPPANISARLDAMRPQGRSRWVLTTALVVFFVLAAAVSGMLFLRKTTITITPRSHAVIFDASSQYAAYPASASSTPSTGLTYTFTVSDLEDSELVPVQGTTHVETKAQGTITVYNNYAKTPVKLVRNTRFMTASGLVFRTPADIVVPGKTGSTPGSVDVSVFADQSGDKYNIAPTRFNVPGLQNHPAMYAAVYAQSKQAFTGGFSGEKPSAPQGTLDAAEAAMRGRLEDKARAAAVQQSTGTNMVLPDLIRITYQSMPETMEQGGVRLHEKAHVEIPVFPASLLAQTLAQGIAADAETASLAFVPGQGFAAHDADAATAFGTGPISFTLAGQGMLVWQIDTGALARALAGRDERAFNTIIAGFTGVQEARTRIEPPWSSTFPAKASDIHVIVTSPIAGA